jgi:NADPH:quinone reductase-like Zn-dependent oxidoreductase
VCAMLQHGGFAQFACAAEDQVVRKPANMSFEDAAAVPLAALTALQCLRDHAQVQLGQRVLINGASGGVGTFAVQIAKLFGANVTGVCSTRNLDMVRAVGADQVIDYTLEDFTKTAQGYDLIFDAVRKRSFSECRRALGPQGIVVTTEVSPSLLLRGLWVSITGSQKLVAMLAQPDQKDLAYLIELVEAGKVKPVIDRSYTLSEVPDAIRYIGKGHARGKVVITL